MNAALLVATIFLIYVRNLEGQNERSHPDGPEKHLTTLTTAETEPYPRRRVKREECGGDIDGSYGIITSPSFPRNYPARTNCTWNIIASETEGIILNFTSFQLEHHENCSYDHVEVNTVEGGAVSSTLGIFCGFNLPPLITSLKNLVVHFRSDPGTEFSGFSVVYQKVFKECAINNGGCKQICERGTDDKTLCSCRSGFVLHPDDRDCPEEYTTGKIVQLTSQTNPNGSLIFSWKWRDGAAPSELTGFYFKGTSPVHSFQMTLPSVLTNLTVGHLHLYTEYDFTLWPVYLLKGAPSEKLGKPIMVSVRTPAAVPMAPKAVTLWLQSTRAEPGLLPLSIIGPLDWNSKPVGFLVRWKEAYADGEHERMVEFPQLVGTAERKKYDVNTTLSLKPGRRYSISASACGLGDFGEILAGPETSVIFGTVPLAPTNFTAQIADPTRALLRWDAPGQAERYEVTVRLRKITHEEDSEAELYLRDDFSALSTIRNGSGGSSFPQEHEDVILDNTTETTRLDKHPYSQIAKGNAGSDILNTTIVVDGSSSTSSYSLPVFGLRTQRAYSVHLRACAANACSQDQSTLLRTPPSTIPAPIITNIFSNTSNSISLEWSSLNPQVMLNADLEFQVRVYKDNFFQLIQTTQSAITISNLGSSTEYTVEVRASLLVAPERRKYSKPAKTVITTRPLVALPPTLSTKGFETAPDVIAVSWSFVNSSVENVEVATNGSSFINCKTSSTCDLVVLHGWNSSLIAGFVKISGLSPYQTYILSLRGCNYHGCGEATTVDVTTGISEPSEPFDLQVSPVDNSTVTFEWQPPIEPAGPLTGYLVSWQCENGPIMAATTFQCFLTIPDLPPQLDECSFSVCAYNEEEDGGELYGKTATLTCGTTI
ncbi:uncharacterized protein LOC144138911 [Haemaphysalis longicornis]